MALPIAGGREGWKKVSGGEEDVEQGSSSNRRCFPYRRRRKMGLVVVSAAENRLDGWIGSGKRVEWLGQRRKTVLVVFSAGFGGGWLGFPMVLWYYMLKTREKCVIH